MIGYLLLQKNGFQMKNNWQTKKLGEVCEIYQPKTITAKAMVPDGKYVVFGANGIIGHYNKYNHEEPQLLITCRGATCGSVNISTAKSWITGNAMVIRPKNTSLNLKYLEYMFRGGLDISKVITGAAQPQITRSNLEPTEISYPNISEQKRIVGVLDGVFENIDKAKVNTEKNLQNSKELFETYLNSIFDKAINKWEQKRFEEIVLSNVIGLVKNVKQQSIIEKYKYVKMNNITRDNLFDLSKYTRVNATQQEIEKYNLIKNDFLFNTRNSYELVGKTCIFGGDKEKHILFNNNIMRVRFIKTINPHFINYAFSSKLIANKIKYLKSGTTNVSAIYYKNLKDLMLSIPSFYEQKSIVKKLDKLSEQAKKLEKCYKQKLLLLEELKKSVLSKAFSGDL